MVFTRVSLNLECKHPLTWGWGILGGLAHPWAKWNWVQSLALPERGNDAQQGLIQPNDIFGVVSQDPVVTGEGDQAASSRAGSLQGK